MDLPVDTIICGDCLDVLPTLPDGCVDAVVTDPPYNVGLQYGAGTNDHRRDYAQWCARWFAQTRRVSGIVAFTPGTPNVHQWLDIEDPDLWLCNFRPNGAGYSKAGFCHWEPILVWGEPRGERATDVIRAPIIPQADAEPHPCPKPLSWALQLVSLLTRPGDIVLDPFCGSGTVSAACAAMGRRFIGIDISEEYCEVARRRVAQALASPRLPLDDPRPTVEVPRFDFEPVR